MSPLSDLNGYSLPLSPKGKAQIVGGLPWHFGVDIVAINFRADPKEIKKLLPEPLEPATDPGFAYVWFGDWLSVWDDAKDMIYTNPERCMYKECLLGVACRYKGQEGHRVVYIWVDKDFSMMRGWFMGFPKKMGVVELGTDKRHLQELNPGIGKFGVGTKIKAWCEAHGERLITGTLDLKTKITSKELPQPFGLDLYHTVHFPNIEIGAKKPLIHQLVRVITADTRFGDIYAGDATLNFHESEIEEHTAIKPKEIIGGYYISVGFTVKGAEVIRRY